MTIVDHFRRLARNNAWSNYRLHKACAALSEADYKAQRTSFFPSLHLTLNHILIVGWYYIDALEGGGKGPALYANDEPFDALPALTEAQVESDRRLIAFCDRLTPAGVDAPVTLVRDNGARYVESAGDVLSHLAIHQVHHRGQVHAMLSGTPVPPPQLDEFFLEQDAPLRDADLRALALTDR